MTVGGEVLNLPILSPVRSPYPEYSPKRGRFRDPQEAWQTPVHRLRRQSQSRLEYGPKGYVVPTQPATGHIIDIYV
jgi:hypothetical protein